MTSKGLLLLILAVGTARCFLIKHQHQHQVVERRQSSSTTQLWGDLDYEYIPSNPHATSNFISNLPSSYPEGTPSGLRGEAVQSALRSGQCVAWRLDDDDPSMQHGIVSAQGKGVLEFLNNKFTQSFHHDSSSSSSFQSACLLNARGRLIDRIGVAVVTTAADHDQQQEAYLLTSAGHSAKKLFDRLDPFIFPLDQVQLKDESSSESSTTIFSLSSVRKQDVQDVFERYIWPSLPKSSSSSPSSSKLELPNEKECLKIPLNDNDSSSLLILPTSGLAPNAVYGYTFCFLQHNHHAPRDVSLLLGESIWQEMTNEDNLQGPVAIGLREFESLRIQSGQVAYGTEMLAGLVGSNNKQQNDIKNDNNNQDSSSSSSSPTTTTMTPPTPLELHLESFTIDTNKGCYLGQEGIAAQLNNPRGPPRTLYQVVFADEDNLYRHQTTTAATDGDSSNNASDDSNNDDNHTHLPKVGDALYVLGSRQEIAAGVITSLAEPGSSGTAETIGLALVRRADSIQKQMASMELEIPRKPGPVDANTMVNTEDEGMIHPPPPPSPVLDPLDGLEVIVGDTYTVGTLRVLPWRTLRPGAILFQTDEENAVAVAAAEKHANAVTVTVPKESSSALDNEDSNDDDDDDDKDVQKALEEAARAEKEAEAAAAEAQRKAEKMEMLKKRAEAAMARRKQRKQQ